MNIEQEPKAVTALTGRMGYLTTSRRGKLWRGALMLSGEMGTVSADGELSTHVPVWFQKQLAKATLFLQGAYKTPEPGDNGRRRWWAAVSNNVTGNYHVGYGDKAVIVVAEETLEESRALAIKIKDFLAREGA